MILYRYLQSHAYVTLRDAELMTSRISTFNDPFELMYRVTGEMDLSRARAYVLSRARKPDFLLSIQQRYPAVRTSHDLKQFLRANLERMAASLVAGFPTTSRKTLNQREKLADENLRVVCFSSSDARPRDEILMWSHYGGKHCGVRIGFEFPPNITWPFKVLPIDYRSNRVEIDLTLDAECDAVIEALNETIRVKSDSWKYELEHRLITTPDNCISKEIEPGRTEHFLKFERSWVKTVDVGARCPSPDATQLRTLVRELYPNVMPRRAKYHDSDYSLVYEPL